MSLAGLSTMTVGKVALSVEQGIILLELMIALLLLNIIMLTLFHYQQQQTHFLIQLQRYQQALNFAQQQLDEQIVVPPTGKMTSTGVKSVWHWHYRWQRMTPACWQLTVYVEVSSASPIVLSRWRCQH